MKRISIIISLFFIIASSPLFAQLNLFRAGGNRVEAEPNKEYYLTDSDGLWFIMAKKFSGEDARSRANRVAYELRKRYKLPAYIFKYDTDADDLSKMLDKRNVDVRKYRYQTVSPPEYAVLVGSFPSVEDPGLEETLLKVKRSKLDSLKNDRESQMLLTEFEFLAKKDKEYTGYGPLGKAFPVPNPLIPKDFFNRKGVVDPFVERLNSDSPYSLLNNRAMYTVRVATFAGNDALAKDWNEKRDRLADAGAKAAALCDALRKKGVEAWEFHDRDASFVTIGGFDSYGRDNPDGTTEMNPEIYRLIERYKGELVGTTGVFKTHALKIEINNPKAKGFNTNAKKIEMELPFDLQPVIIMVPQRPGNAQRVMQAQQRLLREQENKERQRMSESLAVDNTDHSRQYAQQVSPTGAPAANVPAQNPQYPANAPMANAPVTNAPVTNASPQFPTLNPTRNPAQIPANVPAQYPFAAASSGTSAGTQSLPQSTAAAPRGYAPSQPVRAAGLNAPTY